MTPEEFAQCLNGTTYPLTINSDWQAKAQAHQLVVAYHGSGDSVDLHGALQGRVAMEVPLRLSSVGFRLFGGADVTLTLTPSRLSRTLEAKARFGTFGFHTQARRGPYGSGVVFGLKGLKRDAPVLPEAVATRLVQMTNYTKVLNFFAYPGLGQFVVTGPIEGSAPNSRRIGYCVQVRRRWGRHGSDLVILRHADGQLQVHEHQGFFAMTEAQENLAREYFTCLPEDEDYTLGYHCADNVHRVGFLVTETRPQESFAKRYA